VEFFSIRRDPKTGQEYMASRLKGRALLLEPCLNKGTALTDEEREDLDLHGLLPPAVCPIETQLERCYENFRAKSDPLEKYIYLAGLHDRNETLFFRLLHEHIDEMMPIVYTPVVGKACQEFSRIHRRARGLYVSYDQRDQIERILRNHSIEEPSVIVVTDGERILGLGDQGVGGMGIPIGKLCLYTLCAGISPYTTLPVTLDVGTDNAERLADPLYLGLRHERIRGERYQAFVDAFVEAVEAVYPHVLLQWEDFLKGNAIAQLDRFRDRLCTFNDDIQGTAGVVVAGLYGAARITGEPLRDQRVLFAGAGASAQGIAELVVSAMVDEGLSESEARLRMSMTDSRGLVTTARGNLEPFKRRFVRDVAEIGEWDVADRECITLEEAVRHLRPTILIGTSATPGVFTQGIVESMAAHCERPVILPLSNPTSQSECTPEDALRWSDGRAIIATGSPFPPVRMGERTYRIGQGNNAFVFPGVGLGVCASKARRVSDGMFLDAAKALAHQVGKDDLDAGAVYPELTRIRECSHAVACAVVRRAVDEGHADASNAEGVEDRVSQAMWFPDYLPVRFEP